MDLSLVLKKHSLFHRSVYTEIIIDAPKTKVWEVLTNFKEMPEWSGSLQSIEGDFRRDGDTIVRYLLNGKLYVLKHRMVGFEDGTQFGWSDPIIPFAVDNHRFRVEELPDGRSKFIQQDEIKGFMVLFIGPMMMGIFSRTYPEFNQALKKRVEGKMGGGS